MVQEERTITVSNADRIVIVQALQNYLNEIDLEEDGAQQDLEHVEALIKKLSD